MELKLAASEVKVMEVLWAEGECGARHVADRMTERYGWNINSTYTFLKRCIKKGAVERSEPGFLCRALVTREEVQQSEMEQLLDRVFEGSADQLFSALVDRRGLRPGELDRIKVILEKLEREG